MIFDNSIHYILFLNRCVCIYIVCVCIHSEVLAASPLDLVLKEREGGGEGQEDIIESRIKEKIEEEEMVAEELVEKVVMEAVVEAEVVEDNVNEDVTVESPVKQEPN